MSCTPTFSYAGSVPTLTAITHEADFEMIWTYGALPSTTTVVYFRQQDFNNTWQINADSLGQFALLEVVGGAATVHKNSGAGGVTAGYQVKLIARDERIIAYLRDDFGAWSEIWRYDGAVNFKTETSGLISLGTDGTVDDLYAYPLDCYTVVVDWDNDNNFTGAYDDITDDVVEYQDMKWQLGCRPYEALPDEGEMSFLVWNGDKKYSFEYASSPLYGKILPKRRIQVTLNGEIVYTGFIKHVRPAPHLYGERTAEIVCASPKWLIEQVNYFPTLYEDKTADYIIKDILSNIVPPPITMGYWKLGISGFSELGTTTVLIDETQVFDVDTGSITFQYVGDNARGVANDKASGWNIIRDVTEAERGRLYFDRQGRAVFWNRHHLMNDTAVDVTIDNDADQIGDYLTPNEELVNQVEVTVFPRAVSSAGELIWSLTEPLTLSPSEVRIIQIPYGDDSTGWIGAKDLIDPTGDDLVSTNLSSTSIEITAYAQRAEVRVENIGSNQIVITTMNIRATTLESFRRLTYRAEDVSLMADYGTRQMSLSLKAMDDYRQAEYIAKYELLLRSNITTGRVTEVTLRAIADGVENARQLDYGIGSLVRIIDDQTDHDRNYHIVGELHSLDIRNKVHTTTWLLEPAPGNYWILGDVSYSQLGTSTVLAY